MQTAQHIVFRKRIKFTAFVAVFAMLFSSFVFSTHSSYYNAEVDNETELENADLINSISKEKTALQPVNAKKKKLKTVFSFKVISTNTNELIWKSPFRLFLLYKSLLFYDRAV